MAAKVIHDDDIAGRECRHEELDHIGSEALAVNRAIKDARCIDPVMPQRCKEGQRPPFAERSVRNQLAAARRPAPDWRHIRLRPRFVNEDQTPGIKPPLILLPLRAPPGDRRSCLLLGEQAFF
jgi:hypothetical protein